MTERPDIKDCPPALRSLGVVGLSLFLTIISCLMLAASLLYSAEFEVVDKFSVNNYSEFRGSVTIKGSMLDVQNSAQFGSAAKSTFTASGSLNLAPGAALTFSAGAIGDGLIYGQDIAVSTITLDRLNQSGCSPNQIPKWNGAAWSCGTDSGGSGEYVLKAGDAMTGPLTLNGSSLTVTGAEFSVGASTFVVKAGNIGIGTTSPTRLLTVQDSGYNNWLRLGAGSNNSNEFISIFGGNPGAVSGHTVLDSPAIVVPKFLRIFTNASDESGANGVTAMVLDTNGNVGIGTTSPGSKLQVSDSVNVVGGVVRLQGSYVSIGDYQSIVWADVNNNPSSAIKGRASAGGQMTFDFILQQGSSVLPSGTTVMTMRGDGNVGIGTTSPSGKVDIVSGGPGDGIVLRGTGSNSPGIGFYNGATWGGNMGLALLAGHFLPTSAVNDWAFNPQSNLLLGAGGAERVRITSAGNVGIGTTAPGATLHVAQNNGEIRLTRADVTGGIRLFEDSVGNFVYLQKRNDAGNWITMISGTEKQANSDVYLVQGGGNVGIGTTSPSYQLQLSLDSAAKPTSNTWTIASDRRVKKDIEPFTDGLAVIRQINPIRYRLNGKAGLPEGAEGISVVAQEAREAIPYAISTYKARLEPSDALETDIYNFNSSPLTFVLINAVKEQQKEIEELKMKVIELEKRSP